VRVVERQHLQQHLEHLAAAYGADLVLPAGRAEPRQAPEPPAVANAPQPSPPPAPPPPRAEPIAAAAAPVPPPMRTPTPVPAPAGVDVAAALQALRATVMPCTRCKLHEGRRHVVFGEGNPRAEVMFVGEAPGAVEDQTGRPFVGPAGQLLDRIITGAMGLQRTDVFIANINKCRPPGNREPEPDEVAACLPFLRQQLELIRPKVIVCLGRTAAQNLLGSKESTTRLRGRDLEYQGVPVVVTWHPAYLLRDPSHKRETWEDIKRVNRLLGRPEVPNQPTGQPGAQPDGPATT
jgi:uracil-DNA glycosylase